MIELVSVARQMESTSDTAQFYQRLPSFSEFRDITEDLRQRERGLGKAPPWADPTDPERTSKRLVIPESARLQQNAKGEDYPLWVIFPVKQ